MYHEKSSCTADRLQAYLPHIWCQIVFLYNVFVSASYYGISTWSSYLRVLDWRPTVLYVVAVLHNKEAAVPLSYPLEVRVFAVQQRKAGHSWGEVQESVRQQFGLPRLPGRRQMRLWQIELESSTVPNAVQAQVDRMWPGAEQQMREQVDRVTPQMLSAALRGEDVVVFVGKLMLGWLENEAGPHRFMRIVSEYLSDRAASSRRRQEQEGESHEGTSGEEGKG